MPVMDEFKEERAEIKKASPKEKFDYFWYYYKWYVIAGVIAVILLSSLIHDIVTRKDIVFHAAVINHAASSAASDEYRKEAEDYLGIDTAKEEIYIDNTFRIDKNAYSRQSITSSEKLMAQAASADLDVLIAEEALFANYAENHFFCDLSEALTPEEYEALKPYLFYAETENGRIPYGISMEPCTHFLETYLSEDNTHTVIGILSNTKRGERAVLFLKFLFRETDIFPASH